MRSKIIYTDIEVSLDEFDTDDLIEELNSRGYEAYPTAEGITLDEQGMLVTLRDIYEAKKLGKDIDKMLNVYLYEKLGVIL